MEKLEFAFTEQDLNTILEGLGELPAKKSINLILRIQNEAQQQIEQQKAKEKPVKAAS